MWLLYHMKRIIVLISLKWWHLAKNNGFLNLKIKDWRWLKIVVSNNSDKMNDDIEFMFLWMYEGETQRNESILVCESNIFQRNESILRLQVKYISLDVWRWNTEKRINPCLQVKYISEKRINPSSASQIYFRGDYLLKGFDIGVVANMF